MVSNPASGVAWPPRDVRRAEFLDAADRVIRRLGPAASMERIAAEAGITKPILYRHFGDKGGLYQALAERYVAALTAELARALRRRTDPRRRLAATVDAYLAFIERNRAAYDFLMHRAVRERPEAEAAVTGFIRRVAQEVARVLEGEMRTLGMDLAPAEPWAFSVVGAVQLAGEWWLEHPDVPRRRIVDQVSSLLWSGFGGLGGDALGG